VAHTFRFEETGIGLHYYASLFERGALHVSTEFRVKSVVDKVGSGDCFMGGLIFGLYQGRTPAETINFAAAAAFGKLQEHGDATRQTIEQVQNTILQYEQK
jgi:2-dehydro-3-deoxygluconokinase